MELKIVVPHDYDGSGEFTITLNAGQVAQMATTCIDNLRRMATPTEEVGE